MTDDLGFVCPNCNAPIKYTAGMTLGEILSLRHNSQHQAVKIDVLKMEVNVKDARIAELETENTKLRTALKPFSDAAGRLIEASVLRPETDYWQYGSNGLTYGDLRAARAAYLGEKE